MRGNHGASSGAERTPGSIPACAGEPGYANQGMRIDPVYPRVCGGTALIHKSGGGTGGLSPRVRGNRHSDAPTPPGSRSIPACAGEPRGCAACSGVHRVYPRVCGGTCHRGVVGRRKGGLSPRVRGNRRYLPPEWGADGSIPACAGEPPALPCTGCPARVYPRVCGGTVRVSSQSVAEGGLSPRVRGNRLFSAPNFRGSGSIPACAGEPWRTPIAHSLPGVYPRVCGGTHYNLYYKQDIGGLSPRVRGNLSLEVELCL